MSMWQTPNRRRTLRGRRMAHLAGSGYPMSERKAEDLAEPPKDEAKEAKPAPRRRPRKKQEPTDE